VEPPGTAPGSEPIITGAFIAIVGVAPDKGQYRGATRGPQGRVSTVDKRLDRNGINRLVAGGNELVGFGRCESVTCRAISFRTNRPRACPIIAPHDSRNLQEGVSVALATAKRDCPKSI
jgi:hypothetical protein